MYHQIIYTPHWSVATLLFYLFLGVFPMLSARNNIRGTKEYSLYDWLWLLVWSVAGTFRVIQRTGVGGSDTYGYVRYFENCNNEHLNSIYVHIADDWLYKVINQALNAVCADYHFFLFAVYAFETWCFILFYKKFCSQGNNVLPYLLTPFLYVDHHSLQPRHLLCAAGNGAAGEAQECVGHRGGFHVGACT